MMQQRYIVHMTVLTAFFFRITVYVLLYTLLRTSAIWNHDWSIMTSWLNSHDSKTKSHDYDYDYSKKFMTASHSQIVVMTKFDYKSKSKVWLESCGYSLLVRSFVGDRWYYSMVCPCFAWTQQGFSRGKQDSGDGVDVLAAPVVGQRPGRSWSVE